MATALAGEGAEVTIAARSADQLHHAAGDIRAATCQLPAVVTVDTADDE